MGWDEAKEVGGSKTGVGHGEHLICSGYSGPGKGTGGAF